MTIEQKAKAYDQALERAREYWETDNDNTLDIKAKGTMEYLFPELAESEDERIRKEIIDFIYDNETERDAKSNSKWIAWLEKGGSNKEEWLFEKDKWYVKLQHHYEGDLRHFEKDHAYKAVSEVKITDGYHNASLNSWEIPKYFRHANEDEIPKESKSNENEEIKYYFINALNEQPNIHQEWKEKCLIWLEKQGQKKCIDDLTQQEAMDIAVAKCFEQGGQKPVDKVEPKFNIGDWVVNKNGTVQQILSYKNGIYKHTNGYSSKMFEDEWRLWDITKDVKDGDVLADEYGIYIFNSCDSLDDKLFICKCAYEYSKKAFEIGGMLCKKTDVYPASREQRDLLFQKMHEEGYEWNAEKKEVMKIGQKPTEWKQENREELTEFENAMMHIGGSFFGENAGLDPNDTDTIKEQAELLLELAPKTEWSEEDRTMAFTLMRDVDQMSYVSKEGKNERIVWLNSLDEKFASTESAWSEEDERIYQSIIDDNAQENLLYNEQINWLISIKQRIS